MNKNPVDSLIETIDNARYNRAKLAEIIESLSNLKNQVLKSSASANDELLKHFGDLKITINCALEERLQKLQAEIKKHETVELNFIQEKELAINERCKIADEILSEGKKLLMNDPDTAQFNCNDLKTKCLKCSTDGLPDLPDPSEIAFVTIDLPYGANQLLAEAIHDYGRVLRQPPVIITGVFERPGALLIVWNESEEGGFDFSTYQLEYCKGNNSSNFILLYEGPLLQYTARRLNLNEAYTFRVRGRSDTSPIWSAWSVPVDAATCLSNHEWCTNVPGYLLEDNNTTVTLNDSSVFQPLYTNGASFISGHSVMIRILKFPKNSSFNETDGIGLSESNTIGQIFFQQGTVFITVKGKVFLNGQERNSKLPPLREGSCVIFESQMLEADKIRLTIEVDDKVTSFDWPMTSLTPSSLASSISMMNSAATSAANKDKCLYVVLNMTVPGCQIAIQ